MGEYFNPHEKREHRCVLPGTIGPNDGWRCLCGRAYVREALPTRDGLPGVSPYQWRRSPKYDRHPKADQ